MSGDVPLSSEFPGQPNGLGNTPGKLQKSIAERIEELLGYELTNQYLIQFINEFGHPDQLKCEPNESGKRLHSARIRAWEGIFTDSFYRAAVIIAKRVKETHPKLNGVDMEDIILQAEELIKRENDDRESVRKATGYRS